jgi:serine/threonine protein kinase
MPDLLDTQRSPGDAAPTRSCLNDDEVLDFVGGKLNRAQLEAVHAHLDRCTICQQLVGAAVRDKSASDSGEPSDSAGSTTFGPGDVVAGRYRIQRFIARGGMGEVYDAYDRDLQKRVALKTVICTVCDSQRAVRRLKAEVQLAHRVSHANVCRIYDLGVHVIDGSGGNLHFLTMEFVEGQRLAERLERGPLGVGEATQIARQLLLGLDAAHGAGILHRDLKSDNVMLRPAPNGDVTPVILDFGLARTMEVDEGRVTSGVNGLAGTPCYMAPEQLEAGELSAASDIYAFGVILFEMLTGRLPFSLRTPFERLRKPPPRPSSITPDVPSSLDKVVLGCLERLPESRFRSARDVLRALDTVEIRSPDSTASVVAKRRPPHALASAAVVVVLLAILALGSGHAGRSTAGTMPHAAHAARPAPGNGVEHAAVCTTNSTIGSGTGIGAEASLAPPGSSGAVRPAATPRSSTSGPPHHLGKAPERADRTARIESTKTASGGEPPESASSAATTLASPPPIAKVPIAPASPSSAPLPETPAPPTAASPAKGKDARSVGTSSPERFGFADPFRKGRVRNDEPSAQNLAP